jgi:hypothetical protein
MRGRGEDGQDESDHGEQAGEGEQAGGAAAPAEPGQAAGKRSSSLGRVSSLKIGEDELAKRLSGTFLACLPCSAPRALARLCLSDVRCSLPAKVSVLVCRTSSAREERSRAALKRLRGAPRWARAAADPQALGQLSRTTWRTTLPPPTSSW